MAYNDSALPTEPSPVAIPEQTFVLALPNRQRLILVVPASNPVGGTGAEFAFASIRWPAKKTDRNQVPATVESITGDRSADDSSQRVMSQVAKVPAKYRKMVREWFGQILSELNQVYPPSKDA